MSDTFRKIPGEAVEFIKEKKIIRNDKKHQQAIVYDGAFSHPCYFTIKGNGSKIGVNNFKDGLKSPKQKKFAKKTSIKKQRVFGKGLSSKEQMINISI